MGKNFGDVLFSSEIKRKWPPLKSPRLNTGLHKSFYLSKTTFHLSMLDYIQAYYQGLSGLQVKCVSENYFSYFSTKTYVVCAQKNRLNETVLLTTQNTCFNWWVRK